MYHRSIMGGFFGRLFISLWSKLITGHFTTHVVKGKYDAMAGNNWYINRKVTPNEFFGYRNYERKRDKHRLITSIDGTKKKIKNKFFSYMKSVFRSSLITSFPQIASTKSKKRRVWKSLVFLLCLTGFLYQTIYFLKFYYTYPVTVNVEESRPFEIVQPALTFCSNNRIRRQAYCERNETHCVDHDEDSFCEFYPKYCEKNKTLYTKVPTQNDALIDSLLLLEWSQVIEAGATENMIEDCWKSTEKEFLNCSIRPIPFTTKDGSPAICYTVDSQIEMPNSRDDIYANTFKISIELQTFPEEYFYHSDPVLIHMSVHDRRDVLNPFIEGHSIKGGYKYTAHVSMIEDIRLPYPFGTNCTDYLSLWKKNNGTGPINEVMCIESCKIKKVLALNVCVDRYVYYPHFEDVCGTFETITHEIIKECTLNCQPACYERKYVVKYDESEYLRSRMCDEEDTNCKLGKIFLTVSFRKYHLIKRITQAKYNNVELFSYIGGFMGMWLGLSLVSMFDFMESIFRLLYYPFRNKIM